MTWLAKVGNAHLVLTVDGMSDDDVMEQCQQIAEVCEAYGSPETLLAETRLEEENILKMRNELYGALMPQLAESLDLAVPPARVAEFLGRRRTHREGV